MSKEAWKVETSNVLIHTKLHKITAFRLILLEQAPFSNLSIYSHTSNALVSEKSRNYWKVPRFVNLNRFPVKQVKLQESKKKAKQLSIPYLLRNQTPHSLVGAYGVPGVQAITARPQDMTKITEIMEN